MGQNPQTSNLALHEDDCISNPIDKLGKRCVKRENGRHICHLNFTVNNVRTVSDTKRSFYTIHTRPINSIYRRVVEELMVEMHLLSVNVDFRYDPVYALGVMTIFDRFMQGYQPEQDRVSIFDGLCKALQDDPQRYRYDADRLRTFATQLSSAKDFLTWLEGSGTVSGGEDLRAVMQAIAQNPSFKYSRLFAIGIFTLLELADAELIKDQAQRDDILNQISTVLKLPQEKVEKDLELYRSNLDKFAQARLVMDDIVKASKKKRAEQAQAKDLTQNGAVETTDTSKDEASSGT